MADQIICAAETTYATAPASGWRKVRSSTDNHQTQMAVMTHRAIGDASGGAPALEGSRVAQRNATGTLTVPVASNGLGILFEAAASSSTSGVVSGGTLAYEQVFTFGANAAPTGTSVTTGIYRTRRDGTTDWWNYVGGKPTQIEFGQSIAQDAGGFLTATFAMDYQDASRLTVDPSRTVTTPAPMVTYAWEDALITLQPLDEAGAPDGSPNTECLSSFSLTLPMQLDVEDYCLKAGTSRHEPTRNGLPAPTGQAVWTYQHPRYYDAFVAGQAFSVSAVWAGTEAIEASTMPSLTIELGAIRLTGEDPQVAVDAKATQNMPFEVLSVGGAPAVVLTFITSDAAF